MSDSNTRICIADPNPRVRKLLQREFTARGWEVIVARNSSDVLEACWSAEPPDLVVMDPDVSRAESETLLSRLSVLMPKLPVVLHAYAGEALKDPAAARAAAIVEKGGNIQRLGQVVARVAASLPGQSRSG